MEKTKKEIQDVLKYIESLGVEMTSLERSMLEFRLKGIAKQAVTEVISSNNDMMSEL